MIQYLLKNSDFSALFRFASPNFFKVVSPNELLKVGLGIRENYADPETWQALADRGARQWTHSEGPRGTQDFGHALLRLFFTQILNEETWILDFRSDAFLSDGSGKITWRPKPFYHQCSPEFARAVRDLYIGFYLDDSPRFKSALLRLGLGSAEVSLRKHFCLGDQTRVEFRLKHFQTTFSEVFEDCARSKSRLHGEFFALGGLLIGLYENLEKSGETFDVRSSFLDAYQELNQLEIMP